MYVSITAPSLTQSECSVNYILINIIIVVIVMLKICICFTIHVSERNPNLQNTESRIGLGLQF